MDWVRGKGRGKLAGGAARWPFFKVGKEPLKKMCIRDRMELFGSAGHGGAYKEYVVEHVVERIMERLKEEKGLRRA